MARWHTTEWDTLPEKAFQPRGWKGSMTLEGGGKGGGGGAPAPDPNIGIAQRELSALAKEQWNYFTSDIYPEMLRQSKAQEARAAEQFLIDKGIGEFQLNQAKAAYDRYEKGAIPAMEALKKDADQYNEASYREQLSQQAKADVDMQFQNQRDQEAMRQRAYGIDPTSGVATGNMQSIAATQALMGATAQNQVRQAAKDIGLQKQANVYNMYAGLPAQANSNTALSLSAGNQGFQNTQQAFGNLGAISGALNQSAGTAMQGWNSVGQLGVSKYNADVNAYNSRNQAEASNWGSLGNALGSGAALYMKYGTGGSDIRIKENIQRVGTLDNGVPLYKFEYKPEYRDTWGYGEQIGVMAQDVEHFPGVVSMHADGYKLVNYDLLKGF